MPSSYSKKRKKNNQKKKKNSLNKIQTEVTKSPGGGPLKRYGDRAVFWDETLGKSLQSLPSSKLPTKRTVLRRYRHLRIENPCQA